MLAARDLKIVRKIVAQYSINGLSFVCDPPAINRNMFSNNARAMVRYGENQFEAIASGNYQGRRFVHRCPEQGGLRYATVVLFKKTVGNFGMRRALFYLTQSIWLCNTSPWTRHCTAHISN